MHRVQVRIWFFATIFVLGVVGVSTVELVRSYESRIEVVYREADLLGFLVSEWIAKSLEDIRAILEDSLYGIDESSILATRVDERERAERNARLTHKADQYQDIIFLGVFDADCTIQYASIESIVGDSSRELGRDYCDEAMEVPTNRLKFSDLFLSTTGELNVSATFPVVSADGRPIGFALAGLNLSFFQTWLDSIDDPAVAISIIDTNRILLARKPESSGVGERIDDARLEEFVEAGADSVTFRRKSPVDGIERLWSLRKTGEFPFVVAVGYELDDVLVAWRTKLAAYGIGNLLLIVVTIFLALAYQKNKMNARSMEKLAMVDPLTGLMNRRSFNAIARKRFSEAAEAGRADSVVMVDVDYFKRINDQHGHDAGDAALVEVGSRIQASFRSSDLVCRWGGEEFVIYLADTEEETAKVLAERLRQQIAACSVCGDVHLTVSQGIASVRAHGSYEELLKIADERLYEAKAQGRNRVCAE